MIKMNKITYILLVVVMWVAGSLVGFGLHDTIMNLTK